MLEEQPSGPGRLYTTAGSNEQSRSQLFFERLDAAAERRLTHLERVCCPAEVPVPVEGSDLLVVSDRHIHA